MNPHNPPAPLTAQAGRIQEDSQAPATLEAMQQAVADSAAVQQTTLEAVERTSRNLSDLTDLLARILPHLLAPAPQAATAGPDESQAGSETATTIGEEGAGHGQAR